MAAGKSLDGVVARDLVRRGPRRSRGRDESERVPTKPIQTFPCRHCLVILLLSRQGYLVDIRQFGRPFRIVVAVHPQPAILQDNVLYLEYNAVLQLVSRFDLSVVGIVNPDAGRP